MITFDRPIFLFGLGFVVFRAVELAFPLRLRRFSWGALREVFGRSLSSSSLVSSLAEPFDWGSGLLAILLAFSEAFRYCDRILSV